MHKTSVSPFSFTLAGSEEHNVHRHNVRTQYTISLEKSMPVEHVDGNSGTEEKPVNSHKEQPQSVWNNENTSDPNDGTILCPKVTILLKLQKLDSSTKSKQTHSSKCWMIVLKASCRLLFLLQSTRILTASGTPLKNGTTKITKDSISSSEWKI